MRDFIYIKCCAKGFFSEISVLIRWVDDQQQEGGDSGGGDTLIMLRNHMDTILMLSPPLTITTTSYNYLSSKSRQLL